MRRWMTWLAGHVTDDHVTFTTVAQRRCFVRQWQTSIALLDVRTAEKIQKTEQPPQSYVRTLTSDSTTQHHDCTRRPRIWTVSLCPRPSDEASLDDVCRQSRVDRRNYTPPYLQCRLDTLREDCRIHVAVTDDETVVVVTDRRSVVGRAADFWNPTVTIFHVDTYHCRAQSGGVTTKFEGCRGSCWIEKNTCVWPFITGTQSKWARGREKQWPLSHTIWKSYDSWRSTQKIVLTGDRRKTRVAE